MSISLLFLFSSLHLVDFGFSVFCDLWSLIFCRESFPFSSLHFHIFFYFNWIIQRCVDHFKIIYSFYLVSLRTLNEKNFTKENKSLFARFFMFNIVICNFSNFCNLSSIQRLDPNLHISSIEDLYDTLSDVFISEVRSSWRLDPNLISEDWIRAIYEFLTCSDFLRTEHYSNYLFVLSFE